MDLSATNALAAQPRRSDQSKAKWQRILVVIDPIRPGQVALQKATRIALAEGGELELYVCDDRQDLPESWAGTGRTDEYREILRTRALAELQGLAQQLREGGLTVTIRYELHAPLAQGIGQHVVRTRPDLVVKETHPHPLLPESLSSRTDWNLIRQLPADLLLVRAGSWSPAPRVATAVDPMHPADRPAGFDEALVETGHALSDLLHGSFHVLHVLQGVPHLPGEPVAPERKVERDEEARRAVGRLANIPQVATYYAEGNVSEGLIGLAREQAVEILVMGAIARLRSAHATPGGEAARILEHVDCDLLVVKPAGFVSPLLVTSE